MPKSLVIGGTGATGHFIVSGLVERGHDVTILHSGKREIAETPSCVKHIHADVWDGDALQACLDGQAFDLCVATYGRLRVIAQIMADRCDRFISAGGAPAYRGYMNPFEFEPNGAPVPLREDSELISKPEQDEKGYRIVRTEQALFQAIPDATHFRYPFIYGPYQMVPREWLIVRRILDKRPHIILPDGGLSLHSFGYAGNVAHALLLAVDQPQASRGKIYNAADAQVLSLRQVVEIICEALGHSMDIINMPYELAPCTKPLVMQPLSTHRIQDIAAVRRDLGYEDVVAPADALAITARWLVDNPPQANGMEDTVLQDPFDYAAEDELIAAWQGLSKALPTPAFSTEPGWGMAYSGPGGRARSQKHFE